MVLAGNPLLLLLGRKGRAEVIDALRSRPGPWTLRGLAVAAGIPHQVAGRAVAELEALGAVERIRPGRAARITWRPGRAASWLAALDVPRLHLEAAERFASVFLHTARVVWWDPPGTLLSPVRLALVTRDEDGALEAAGAGLDAVAAAGLPAVELATITPDALRAEDPVAQAIRRGTIIK